MEDGFCDLHSFHLSITDVAGALWTASLSAGPLCCPPASSSQSLSCRSHNTQPHLWSQHAMHRSAHSWSDPQENVMTTSVSPSDCPLQHFSSKKLFWELNSHCPGWILEFGLYIVSHYFLKGEMEGKSLDIFLSSMLPDSIHFYLINIVSVLSLGKCRDAHPNYQWILGRCPVRRNP